MMFEIVLLILSFVNLFFLLGLCNEVLDIEDYLYFKDLKELGLDDESDL